MDYLSSLTYLCVFAVLSIFFVELGLFDAAYREDERFKSLLVPASNTWSLEWCKIHVVLLTTFVVVTIRGQRWSSRGKITIVDFFFLAVFNGLALMQSVGLYLLYRYHLPDITIPDKDLFLRVSRLRAFADWVTIPLLGWVIAWSRHVRRGWYPRRNQLVFAISTMIFFITMLHKSAYSFQLCVAGVLSCIAVYELYNVHFFRPGVKPMVYVIVMANVVACLTRLIEPYVDGTGWCLYYINVTSCTCVTVVLSIMMLKILEEVNAHKL